MIGHTQPRRIAARSVAERIAEELGTELGDDVGYQVRFTDRTSTHEPGQGDDRRHPARRAAARPRPAALRHDHHRRGPRAQPQHRLPARLPQAAAAAPSRPQGGHHLRDDRPGAVRRALRRSRRADRRRSSRSPGAPTRSRSATARCVEDPEDDEEGEPVVRDQTEAIVDAVDELVARDRRRHPRVPAGRAGDPRHRRRAASAGPRDRRGFDIVPLYSRLSAAEQHRVFERHTRRRVVLATNVAETSLTVPGIRYVIDTGVARISRYSARTKVQRLPIEPISQASAQQRSGRCGRVEAGIAIRLYCRGGLRGPAGVHRAGDPAHHLACVILQMTSLRARRGRPVPVRRPARQAHRHAPASSCWRSSVR